MTNIIDYVKWRGDLSFQNDPFNDIDALALSLLIYVEFNNVVISEKCYLKDVKVQKILPTSFNKECIYYTKRV